MAGVRRFDEGEILAEALDVFWRKGLSATTMQDIAQATGVLRGSLYNAYGGKEEIFLLAFDAYAGRFLAGARKALESTPDPEQALRTLFGAAIASMTRGSPARGCLSTKTATEPAALDDPRLQARLRGLLDGLRGIVLAALSTDAARARLAVTPEEAADLVVTFTRGLAVMERVYQDAGHLERIAAALVRTLFRERRRPVQSGTKITSTQ
ncbi:TetR/AcrR family transcriptional regulator [Inquilinus sp. Marseille-Q2685]|uniref:TetR/AcrR family transcriptional regulator n=1 Tax=Inquilinus sp. Marseille-Q2685 TaxID=2866581 RepID=UPI001CE44F96|nr:TetR/AcrR family transcriptional regulator [Inquilinus sp. Marseille-Q2685]